MPREDVDHGVYLNADEQAAILALDLEADAARMWDAFIFGCQLGMRHCDLSALTPVHRRADVVNINTQKTGTPVWVPLNELARRLWDAHGGMLQIPWGNNEFLFMIKDLGDTAGLDKLILFSRTEAGQKVEQWMEK